MARMRHFNLFNTFLILSLMISMVLSQCINVEAAGTSAATNDYAEGDNVSFGTLDGLPLEWTILSYDSTTGIAFVCSKKPLASASIADYKKQLATKYPDCTNRGFVRWNYNEWRTWLNGAFYKNCFTSTDRANIQSTKKTATEEKDSLMNYFHDTTLDAAYIREGAKYDMDISIYNATDGFQDYIFFLSSDEYTQYKDKINISSGYIWALRTTAYHAKNRTLCVNETNSGLIEAFYHYENNAIRPAMYVKLKDVSSTDDTNSGTDTSTSTSTTTSTTTTEATVVRRSYLNNATQSSDSSSGIINLPWDSEYTIKMNKTAKVTIDLDYLNYSTKEYTVKYSSSDESFFTVDDQGQITAKNKQGGAVLTVKMKKSNGKDYTMTCNIRVE